MPRAASLLGLRVEGNESKPVPAPSPLSSSATRCNFRRDPLLPSPERLDRCGLHGALNPCPSARGSTAERQTPPSRQVCPSVGYDRTNVRSRSSGCPARSWQLRLRRLPRRAHRRRPESGQLGLLPCLPLRVEGICDRRSDLCNRHPVACPCRPDKGIRNAAMTSLASATRGIRANRRRHSRH